MHLVSRISKGPLVSNSKSFEVIKRIVEAEVKTRDVKMVAKKISEGKRISEGCT